MTGDILIIETGTGGDVTLLGNDLASVQGLQNMPYLAWFGGNVGYTTANNRPENTEVFDFWGNFLNESANPQTWFNSLLENALKNTAITPQGIREIETAARKDLDFMRGFATVSVSVSAPAIDRVKIDVILRQIETNEEDIFSYIWAATENELISPQSYEVINQGQGMPLPYLIGIEL